MARQDRSPMLRLRGTWRRLNLNCSSSHRQTWGEGWGRFPTRVWYACQLQHPRHRRGNRGRLSPVDAKVADIDGTGHAFRGWTAPGFFPSHARLLVLRPHISGALHPRLAPCLSRRCPVTTRPQGADAARPPTQKSASPHTGRSAHFLGNQTARGNPADMTASAPHHLKASRTIQTKTFILFVAATTAFEFFRNPDFASTRAPGA